MRIKLKRNQIILLFLILFILFLPLKNQAETRDEYLSTIGIIFEITDSLLQKIEKTDDIAVYKYAYQFTEINIAIIKKMTPPKGTDGMGIWHLHNIQTLRFLKQAFYYKINGNNVLFSMYIEKYRQARNSLSI